MITRLARPLALCLAIVTAACGTGAASRKAPPKITLAVVPMGTTQQYWLSVHAGALRAAVKENVNLLWPTPFADGDINAQIAAVRTMRARGAVGVAIAPIDPKALVPVVDELVTAGVRVVTFDSPLGRADLPYVGSNSYEAGRLAGEHMAGLLNGQGSVLLLRPSVRVASGDERVRGFRDAIAVHPGMSIAGEQRVDGLIEDAFVRSHDIIKAMRARGQTFAGVFCPNETTTIAMQRAVENLGLQGKVHVVGFDTSPLLANLLRLGKLSGLIVQHSDEMGYLSVDSLVRLAHGETFDTQIFTPSHLVTPATASEPELARLLAPNLMLDRNAQ